MIFNHSILSGYIVIQGSYVIHIPMLVAIYLFVQETVPSDEHVRSTLFRGDVIGWYYLAISMHFLLAFLSMIKIHSDHWYDTFPGTYKSVQVISVLLEILSFCKMLQLYGDSKMKHHLPESRGVQEFLFWILIEIVIICLTVVVPTIFLLTRPWFFKDLISTEKTERGLDDDTLVDGRTWASWKEKVMPKDYKGIETELWYTKLNKEDKKLL